MKRAKNTSLQNRGFVVLNSRLRNDVGILFLCSIFIIIGIKKTTTKIPTKRRTTIGILQ